MFFNPLEIYKFILILFFVFDDIDDFFSFDLIYFNIFFIYIFVIFFILLFLLLLYFVSQKRYV